MAASITIRALPSTLPSKKKPASDNEQTSEIANTRMAARVSSFFLSLVWILCELSPAASSLTKNEKKRVTKAELRNLWQIIRLMAEALDLLDGRDRYQFLESVRSYLQWRVTSQRKKFTSWRNQPPEVGTLTHAINILNQLLNSGILAEENSREHKELFEDLGRLLDQSRKQAAITSLPSRAYRKAA